MRRHDRMGRLEGGPLKLEGGEVGSWNDGSGLCTDVPTVRTDVLAVHVPTDVPRRRT